MAMTGIYEQQHDTAAILADHVFKLSPGDDAIVRLGGGVGTGRTRVLELAGAKAHCPTERAK